VLEYRILGPLEVVGKRGPLRLGGAKQRAALAVLVLNTNRVVSVDRLADDLYAGAPPLTAVSQVQRQISELRKVLGDRAAIETHPPGYVLRTAPGQTDLDRFERLAREASDSEPEQAARLLREAVDLWRGTTLADLADEPFAIAAGRRLEEIRLAALEQRIDADLELGHHRELIAELESLRVEHPLRESFVAQLMLALYRSGRQADALAVFRDAREALVTRFGIEPGPALRELERGILRHEDSLAAPATTHSVVAHGVLAVARGPAVSKGLLRLARLAGDEVIFACLVGDGEELADVERLPRGERLRAAAFVTQDTAEDTLRLAEAHDVGLVLMCAPPALAVDAALPEELHVIFARSPANVGLLVRDDIDFTTGKDVLVPFGGGEHEWAALEVAARVAATAGLRLVLLGTRAGKGRRDASRLLADASLAVQQIAGVEVGSLLTEPTEDALVADVEGASLVVAGIAPRYRQEGIGRMRRALVARASAPVLLVHAGLRPGGLAPRWSRTRFTWSLAA